MLPAQRFLTHVFWAGLVGFWGLSCPGGPKKQSKMREASPPHPLPTVWKGPPGPPKRQKSEMQVGPKTRY